MNESIGEIELLLREIVVHLQAGTTADARKAAAKLERVAALASTMALTIRATRRWHSCIGRFLECAAHGIAGEGMPDMGAGVVVS